MRRGTQADLRTRVGRTRWGCILFGAQPAERTQVRIRTAGLRRAEAAARCGSIRNRKFSIQNSRFKIRWGAGYAWAYISIRAAACGELARADLRNTKPQASARRRLRTAAASLKPQIHDSRFKINFRAGACEETAQADAQADASSGPSRGEAAARCAPAGAKTRSQIQNYLQVKTDNQSAAERTGCTSGPAGRETTALRRGAAGCRSLRDRFYRKTPRQRPANRGPPIAAGSISV